MLKFIRNIKTIQKELKQLRGEFLRYRNWHVCNNCDAIFERGSCITSRFDFDYCATCRPIMKEKQELDAWIANNKDKVTALKNDSE